MPQQPSWYVAGASRSSPLQGNATAVDRDGKLLPDRFLSSCRIRFATNTSDDTLYLAYGEVKTNITAAFARSSDGKIVASVSVPRATFLAFQAYPVLALDEDQETVGFVVFGDALSIADDSWRFSSYSHSGLLAALASPKLRQLSSPRFGRQLAVIDAAAVLRLVGEGDVEVLKDYRVLDGISREAVIVRLVRGDGQDIQRLLDYAGDCGRRPESDTCQAPTPIERIGPVEADCCGRITIEFQGCGEMHSLTNACGVVLDCHIQVGETCPKSPNAPNEQGQLPIEVENECVDESLVQSDQINASAPPWWAGSE